MVNIFQKQFLLFNPSEPPANISVEGVFYYDNIREITDFSAKKYPIEQIEWNYNENNLRIPYVNGKRQQLIAVKDEYFNYISSARLLEDTDIICGEKFIPYADIFAGTIRSYNSNQNNKRIVKKFVNFENANDDDIKNSNKIFVKTEDLQLLKNKFGKLLENKIIISHNSDNEITDKNLIKEAKVQFSQNCVIKAKNLVPIPIGIENSQWFDHSILHNVRKMNIPKTKNIYFLFSLKTHKSRKNCFDILSKKLEWNTKLPKEEYFKELKRHKYAICPRGNGLDTHRLWECLYLDVIPIMLKKDSTNISGLPIIYLDKWEDLGNLTNNFINQKLSKISMRFYTQFL
jgi:hypothetical protein